MLVVARSKLSGVESDACALDGDGGARLGALRVR